MRILVAVIGKRSTDTLKWAARAGFNLRVFVKNKSVAKWERRILDLNYDQYLDLPLTVIETQEPEEFAKENGFDLLVMLPDNLKKWDEADSIDGTVYHYQKDIGIARKEFADQPELQEKLLHLNGAKIIRL